MYMEKCYKPVTLSNLIDDLEVNTANMQFIKFHTSPVQRCSNLAAVLQCSHLEKESRDICSSIIFQVQAYATVTYTLVILRYSH